jgi:hypothetical protein
MGKLSQYWGPSFQTFAESGDHGKPVAFFAIGKNTESYSSSNVPYLKWSGVADHIKTITLVNHIDGHPVKTTAYYWTGSSKVIRTSSVPVYASDKGQRYHVMNVHMITTVCAGPLKAVKVLEYTKPGKNAQGETQVTASIEIIHSNVPDWLSHRAPAVFLKPHKISVSFVKMNDGWKVSRFDDPEMTSLLRANFVNRNF